MHNIYSVQFQWLLKEIQPTMQLTFKLVLIYHLAIKAVKSENLILDLICMKIISLIGFHNYRFVYQFLANVNSSSRSLYVIDGPSVCLSSVCLS